MVRTRVAVMDDYQGAAHRMAAWDSLPDCEVVFFREPVHDADRQAAVLKDFDILCTMRERMPLSNDALARLPRLRMIAATGGQQQAFSIPECTRRGILVCGTGGGTQTTVEITLALILAAARNLFQEGLAMRAGRWQTTTGVRLEGKTLTVIGLGGIGSEVARIAQVFRTHVISWSQTLTPERAQKAGVEIVSREEAFSRADFVSLHLRLVPATRGLVTRTDLARMKPSAYLINTARAELVDRDALLDTLRNRRIAGAGLDVHYQEPMRPDDPFLTLDNAVLTPHLGYVTEERLRTMHGEQVENIRNCLAGAPTRVLNPDALTKK